ncbi:MAG TPA: DUF4367 domain-containing protein [Candidatus Saccharibacteria bacterium]|nr:DUF4367 domain-containing protein [Candidatus Saccharibacteria bacterium]
MSAKHTITINGKLYNTATGLPVDQPTEPRRATSGSMDIVAKKPVTKRVTGQKSSTIHQQAKRSTTLRRQHLSKPTSKVAPHAPVRRASGHTGRSPMIVHFAAHPQPLPKRDPTIVEVSDKPVALTSAPHSATAKPRLSSVEVKEKLIANASHHVTAVHNAAPKKTKKSLKAKKSFGKAHIVTAAFALMLLGGYMTYISVPGLSVSMAGSQAGVAAKYPNYSPDGYSFEGPVAYQPGQVALSFKSNGGGNGYTIEQRASTWNSVALLDNFVEKASKGNYETTSQNGVTIYTYGNNAAWTNGGVFYNITGEAPLNNDQLLHIAASM